MKKLSIISQTAVGRAAIGFIGTAFVLLVTPLFASDTSAAVQLSAGVAPKSAVTRPS